MYNFIFNFFYRYHKKGNDVSPRYTAAGAVAITVFFHVFLIANIITYFTGIKIAGEPLSQNYFTNKLYMLPFGLLYFLFFILFYNKERAINIVNKYPDNYKLITFKNVLLILLIMIAPLVIGVQFLKHSHV